MSLLDNLPHKCTIRRRVRAKDEFGGSVDTFLNEQTDVSCWEQAAGDSDVLEFQKMGERVTRKVYFTFKPDISTRHQILVTERNGVVDTNPAVLDVKSTALPDSSVGKQLLWRVFCDEIVGSDN